MSLKKSSKSFNFLDLDSRLNTKKIQQTKRQQKQKNILNIYQKKIPNFQLINACDKAIKSYKDHYNINRRFSLFHEEKRQKSQQKLIHHQAQKQTNKLPSLKALQQLSSKNIISLQRRKSLSLFQAQKVMKPIKSNHYLNEKGIVLLQGKKSNPSISNQHRQQVVKNINNPIQMSQRSKSYRIGYNLSQKSLSSKKNQDKPIQNLSELKTQVNDKNSLKIRIKRRKQLMIMFRRNVQLIIHKLKMMKLSFSQLLENKIFDKSTPYKFGQQIFHSIKEGNEPKVFRMMIQNRLSIFSFDTTGKTTLIWACIRGYHKIAQLLLSNGVQTHAQDINGRTALFYAIKYNHLECTKILFIYSYHLQEDLQKQNMSVQMRKILRIGFTTHKFLKTFDNVNKKKEHFEHEYKYYFKE